MIVYNANSKFKRPTVYTRVSAEIFRTIFDLGVNLNFGLQILLLRKLSLWNSVFFVKKKKPKYNHIFRNLKMLSYVFMHICEFSTQNYNFFVCSLNFIDLFFALPSVAVGL